MNKFGDPVTEYRLLSNNYIVMLMWPLQSHQYLRYALDYPTTCVWMYNITPYIGLLVYYVAIIYCGIRRLTT